MKGKPTSQQSYSPFLGVGEEGKFLLSSTTIYLKLRYKDLGVDIEQQSQVHNPHVVRCILWLYYFKLHELTMWKRQTTRSTFPEYEIVFPHIGMKL